jgi:hypothetical protein
MSRRPLRRRRSACAAPRRAATCATGSWPASDAAAISKGRGRTSAIDSAPVAIGALPPPDVTRHPRLASPCYHGQKWANSWIGLWLGHAPPSCEISEERLADTRRNLASPRGLSRGTLGSQALETARDFVENVAKRSRMSLDQAPHAVLEVPACMSHLPRRAGLRSPRWASGARRRGARRQRDGGRRRARTGPGRGGGDVALAAQRQADRARCRTPARVV